MTTDLFPETLLVSREGARIYTTSLMVAEFFDKQHKDVLRAIRKAVEEAPDEISRRNFTPRDYVDARGQKQPIYELTHDGFMFVVQGFTGKKAVEWKWKFIAAFREMERQLAAIREREANALYAIKPRWKAISLHPELSRRQLILLTGHRSTNSITACRSRMRDAGLLPQRSSK